MNSKISLYSTPFSSVKSYFEMVDIAAEYGLNLETINSFELKEPDLEFAKKLRKYADEKNVKVTCVSVGMNIVGDDSREMIEKMKKYADVAAILGSPYLHHTVAFYFFNPDEVLKNRDEYLEKGIAAIQEIYDYAEKLGVRTLHEDQGFIFNGVDGFGKIRELSGRNTGVVADFGNILFADGAIEEFIPKFADKIMNVHIKDYTRVPEGAYEADEFTLMSIGHKKLQDCAFGEGVVDFDRAFEELEKMGYDGYYAMECPPLGDERKTFEDNIKLLERYINRNHD